MNIVLVCLLSAYAVAVPLPDGLYPAAEPHLEYGPPVEQIRDEFVVPPPVAPSAEYGLPAVQPIIPAINEESSAEVVPPLSIVPVPGLIHHLPHIPTYLPFVPLVQQPLPLIVPSIPFISTGHISGFQTIIEHPSVSVSTPETSILPDREVIETVSSISESGHESNTLPLVPQEEYGLPVEDKFPIIPAAPALPELPEPPKITIAAEIASIPVVNEPYSVPHSEYGVPELKTTTFAPPVTSVLGTYPPKSEIISHYGEQIQLPESFLSK